MPLAFGVHRAPQVAPDKVLRQIDSEAQALRVSIHAGGHKLDYVAACINCSRSYVSRMQTGKRPIPADLVAPLCAATGSLLLAQYLDLQSALRDAKRETSPRELTRRLAAELREQAA